MTFQAHGITNVGRVRSENQDRILALDALGCFAVFDGMGGQRCGDVAAGIGLTVFQNYIESSGNPAEVTWPFGYNLNLSLDANRLLTSIRLANRQVASHADRDPKCAGMGTTVAAVLYRGGRLAIANVGDSRVYRLRGGELEQFSTDDTMAALMVSKGVIAPQSVPAHPMRGVLMQAIGLHGEVEVHIREEDMQSGDMILLCSDGLYGVLDAAAITAILSRTSPVAERTSDLIEGALAGGAPDNVSVVLIEFAA
jgi:serine/threonine protein phosphatase PrpC